MKVDQICGQCFRVKPCGCVDAARKERNRTRSKEKGYKTARWQRLRTAVLLRDGHRCRRCRSDVDLTVDVINGIDHRKARPSDCQTLCRRCHGIKDGAQGVASVNHKRRRRQQWQSQR